MIKVLCDRCETDIGDEGFVKLTIVGAKRNIHTDEIETVNDTEAEFHICRKCFLGFDNFIYEGEKDA